MKFDIRIKSIKMLGKLKLYKKQVFKKDEEELMNGLMIIKKFLLKNELNMKEKFKYKKIIF